MQREPLLHDANQLVTFLRQALSSSVATPVGSVESFGPAQNARAAAVLAPLYALDGQPHLLFTRRSADLSTHKGEISFPGGSRESVDTSLAATALRESQEEIGLDPAQVEVLGALPSMFAAVSDFMITPYVGWLGEGSPHLTVNAAEVAEVIHAPLAALADPAIHHSEVWRRFGEEHLIHFYDFGPYRIWGATGHMLYQLLQLLPDTELA